MTLQLKLEGINMSQEVREKVRILAGEALAYFECKKRDDGTEYWVVEDGAPEWVHELAWVAHAKKGILPEDFRYLFIIEALEALAENPEEPDILLEPDVYTSRLIEWLNACPGYRMGFVDEAVSQFGWNGLFEALQAGQLMEKEEVLQLVLGFLEKKAEEEF